MISEAMPSVQMLRFVNSGTEATMTALRLARAFTERDMIVKFAGGYHGHADGLLVKAGSGATTLSIPDSLGIPSGYTRNTLTATYNDDKSVENLFKRYPKRIAAVIVEPVAANMGVVPPKHGFLEGLRRLTSQFGALLIFDEVITGFRVAYGGAQTLYQVIPDLTCLGKIIGGGLPVGAYGGRRDVMEMMAPVGQVYQAGTLSGNPVAMTAGIETLKILNQHNVYNELEKKTETLGTRIAMDAAKIGVELQISRVGSLLTIFFTNSPVTDYVSAKQANTEEFSKFFHVLLTEGIYWPPSQFEASFTSIAHNNGDIEFTIKSAEKALNSLKK